MWYPKISSSRSLCKGSVLHCTKNEEIYGIVPYKIFFMSCYISYSVLKENFNMWVTSGSYVGHIQIVLWVSGSNGSTGVTHFQPWYYIYVILSHLRSKESTGIHNPCIPGFFPYQGYIQR